MITAQVSDKGQITIPADVRRKLGLKAKSRVEIEIRDNTAVIKPMMSILELSGILHDRVKDKTVRLGEGAHRDGTCGGGTGGARRP